MLHLNHGSYYLFDVQMEDGSKCYCSTDMVGGPPTKYTDPVDWVAPLLDGAPKPISSGTICLKVDADKMPKIFYFVNDQVPFASIMMVVHRK
jgi:hypothetical protein